jgi:P4 family phage/plasmid primase-like protien
MTSPAKVTPIRRGRPKQQPDVQVGEGPYIAGAFKWAGLLADQIRGRYRYAPGLGWRQYDGACWQEAYDEQLIPELRRTIEVNAPRIIRERGRDGALELAWASASGIASILRVAKGTEGIFTRDQDFDAERPAGRSDLPYLFPCANGVTIELYDNGTWLARPSDPNDLLTRCGCAYEPDATAPTVEEMFELYQPNPEIRRFMYRVKAGSLRGVQIQHLFAQYGEKGGNGKGTMQAVFSTVFGGYAMVLPVKALMKSSGSGAGREFRDEIVQLKGKRLVYASEPEEGARFDAGVVSELIGGTVMRGRGIGLRSVEFLPQFTLCMPCNKRPRWSDHGGLKRRYNETSWDYKIPEGCEDDSVKDRMIAEVSGVLNIILAHWADWCANGVAAPEAVREQTEVGRKEADAVQRFFSLRCVIDPALKTRAGKLGLYDAYKEWCAEENERPVSGNTFAAAVVALRGVIKLPRSAVGHWYEGIGLLDE